MLKDGRLIGAIVIYRQEVRPFSNKHIELVSNFAAQAVIAIENTRLLSELRESLEQQTATSEVLGVISSSPGELEPVFNKMLQNATRVCNAEFGTMLLQENGGFRHVALHNMPHSFVELINRNPIIQSQSDGLLGRAALTKRPVRVSDFRDTPAYRRGDESATVLAQAGGARSALGVPMLKDGKLVGIIAIFRQEVRPFTERQIDLVTNFAKQAVIAIENARLLNELRQRTADLTELLEQQTATSRVLEVISRSAFDLNAIFETVAESSVRLCGADRAFIFRFDGELLRMAVAFNATPEFKDWVERHPIRPGRHSGSARAALERRTIHIPDVLADPEYSYGAKDVEPIRTVLGVPILKGEELLGVMMIYHLEVRPFKDKQIALVETFADQAAIAIENTRLLAELRELLDRQTATSEVLQVISSSPGELQAVFSAMLERATRICEANFGGMLLQDAGVFRSVAEHNVPLRLTELMGNEPEVRAPSDSPLGRLARTKQVVHVADLREEPAYIRGAAMTRLAEAGAARTILYVPMLKEAVLIGVIGIYRQEVRPFTDKQIDLVANFAKQAVIAIENTRLLNELRELLRQQTATADVLKVISRSTFDLKAVLKTLTESAANLCDADMACIMRPSGKGFGFAANYLFPDSFVKLIHDSPVDKGSSTVTGRVLAQSEPVHIHDALADSGYPSDVQKAGGFRTLLGIPLLREDNSIGVLVLARNEVKPFSDKLIALATTFADQAVIAVENVRLFDEIQDKGRQLEIASQHKSQFLANMSHELRTPLNAILGYTELILDSIYGEPPEKMRAVLERLHANGKHLLNLINDVLDLSKIEAGQLTLDLGDYSLDDVVHTVVTAVEPLATGKALALAAEVGKDLPIGHGDGRRLAQVLLNLVGNAIKFTDRGQVTIRADAADGVFTVSVSDTGPGIAASDQTKLFQEFQQADNTITKQKGGTGLGLAISKRIIEMHGGRIWVESQVGTGSTFTFTVPIRAQRGVTSDGQVHTSS